MNRSKEFYDREYLGDRYCSFPSAEEHPFYGELKSFIETYNLYDKKCLEIGCGRGLFQHMVEDYTGVDISETVRSSMRKPFCRTDAADLPIADNTFDAIWTYAVLEHLEGPEAALEGMRRVLKDGGLLLLSAAWQCRPWAADGYPVRAYREFGLKGKMIKASIPIRNSVLYRSAFVFPKRLMRAITLVVAGRPLPLKYGVLRPNLEKFWMPDSDALNSIDPYEVILWFLSRGDRCVTYPGALRRFFVRSGSMVFRINKSRTGAG